MIVPILPDHSARNVAEVIGDGLMNVTYPSALRAAGLMTWRGG
jgi:hypothetical protein